MTRWIIVGIMAVIGIISAYRHPLHIGWVKLAFQVKRFYFWLAMIFSKFKWRVWLMIIRPYYTIKFFTLGWLSLFLDPEMQQLPWYRLVKRVPNFTWSYAKQWFKP